MDGNVVTGAERSGEKRKGSESGDGLVVLATKLTEQHRSFAGFPSNE